MVTKPKISIREMYGLFAMMSDSTTCQEWLKILKEYCEENSLTFVRDHAILLFETFEDED